MENPTAHIERRKMATLKPASRTRHSATTTSAIPRKECPRLDKKTISDLLPNSNRITSTITAIKKRVLPALGIRAWGKGVPVIVLAPKLVAA